MHYSGTMFLTYTFWFFSGTLSKCKEVKESIKMHLLKSQKNRRFSPKIPLLLFFEKLRNYNFLQPIIFVGGGGGGSGPSKNYALNLKIMAQGFIEFFV